jgi:hypothetical protein
MKFFFSELGRSIRPRPIKTYYKWDFFRQKAFHFLISNFSEFAVAVSIFVRDSSWLVDLISVELLQLPAQGFMLV